MSDKKVIIYSTPSCVYCQMAKDFFRAHNIEFEDKNVAEDEQARNEMVERSGQMGVPVIFIGDNMVIGFDEERIKELLGL